MTESMQDTSIQVMIRKKAGVDLKMVFDSMHHNPDLWRRYSQMKKQLPGTRFASSSSTSFNCPRSYISCHKGTFKLDRRYEYIGDVRVDWREDCGKALLIIVRWRSS